MTVRSSSLTKSSSKIHIFNYLCLFTAFLASVQAMSNGCKASIQSFTVAVNASASCPIVSVLNSTTLFEQCTISSKGVTCSNLGNLADIIASVDFLFIDRFLCLAYLGQVFQIADTQNTDHPIMGPYFMPSASTCPLCEDSALSSNCEKVFDFLTTLILDVDAIKTNETYFNISPATYNSEINSFKSSCSDDSDKQSLAYLAYQSQLVCSQSNSYNHPTTSYNVVQGVMDMRSLMQCGTCAMIPCVPGQFCAENEAAVSCPAGSYCPTTSQKIRCPVGYFCPESSIKPIKCRTLAAGSCREMGSRREVVWIPLLVCLCIYAAVLFVYNDRLFPYLRWQKVRGLSRPDPNAVKNRSALRGPSKRGPVRDYQSLQIAAEEDPAASATIDRPAVSKVSDLKVSISFKDVKMVTRATTR